MIDRIFGVPNTHRVALQLSIKVWLQAIDQDWCRWHGAAQNQGEPMDGERPKTEIRWTIESESNLVAFVLPSGVGWLGCLFGSGFRYLVSGFRHR
jgi:hypothetical protein